MAVLFVLAAAACQREPSTAVPTVAVTRTVATPSSTTQAHNTSSPSEESAPGDRLVICLPEEPDSLYLYGEPGPAARAVMAAVFVQDFITLSYAAQPLGLEKVPSLEDGDAAVRLVQVDLGDRVVDANGEVVVLAGGERVHSADGTITEYNGTPLIMEQMVVDFVMKQRTWSDGKPVTADDSVYGFELDAHPDTPGDKWVTERTAAYLATGTLRTRWTGLPGFRHPGYATTFWRPAPRHLWHALSPQELLSAPLSSREPVGDGPFRIATWVPGEMIRLEKNPAYYRSSEGLPHVEEVTFLFQPDLNERLSGLLRGSCDIVPRDGLGRDLVPFFEEAQAAGLLAPIIRSGPQRVELLLGINSSPSYGDGVGRPDWFEDQRFREALALCINRPRIAEAFTQGRSAVSDSYVPPEHPLHTGEIRRLPFDRAAANRILAELGYSDLDGNGILEEAPSGNPLAMTLLVPQDRSDWQMAEMIASDLLDCGIQVSLQPMGEAAAGEEALIDPLHGRRFDLALVTSPAGVIPDCDRYASWQIPDSPAPPEPVSNLPVGRPPGTNLSGWSNATYDAICASALNALPGTESNTRDHQEAQRLYAQELPSIPLFLDPQTLVGRPHVLHLNNDPSAETDLWNLFAIDLGRQN